jgi:hypothetical protein
MEREVERVKNKEDKKKDMKNDKALSFVILSTP